MRPCSFTHEFTLEERAFLYAFARALIEREPLVLDEGTAADARCWARAAELFGYEACRASCDMDLLAIEAQALESEPQPEVTVAAD